MTLPEQRGAYVGIKVYVNWVIKKYGDNQYIQSAKEYLKNWTWHNDYSETRVKIEKDPTRTYIQ